MLATHPQPGPRLIIDNDTAPRPQAAVVVQGSKNCFNHMAVVGLLGDRDHSLALTNAPDIADRATVSRILRSVGLSVETGADRLTVVGELRDGVLDPSDIRRLRVSICYGCAVAAVRGRCWIPLPGGDAFTTRPVDLHLSVLAAAGAHVRVLKDGIEVAFDQRPRGFRLNVSGPFGPSMGASVTALAVASVARGESVLSGMSIEPEVEQVKRLLRSAGVVICDAGPGTCLVEGADGPLSGSVTDEVPPDRMEAASYIFLAAAKKTPLRLDGLSLVDLPTGLRRVLAATHVRVSAIGQGSLQVNGADLGPADLETAPHPGYPTDAQPQLTALLAFADGVSSVQESVYPRRTSHVAELAKLGVHIDVEGTRQIILGPQRARNGVAEVKDIRCGAALLVAASTVPGRTVLADAPQHLLRGYSDLVGKLGTLGMSAAWVA
jgi:UDP-N-acetylglucosamine 1-carboxyvinyltransferase